MSFWGAIMATRITKGVFMPASELAQWLKVKCEEEHLSLRQAAAKVKLSHATIADVLNGAKPSAETVKKLAEAFGGNGHERLALEDRLLTYSGYRSERPGGEIREPVARLLDRLSQFSDSQLKVMERFADFVTEFSEAGGKQ